MCYDECMYSFEKIIKLRKSKNLKLKDLAKVIGTSLAYYHMLEQGKRKLYYDQAIKLAIFFNTTPDELFLK